PTAIGHRAPPILHGSQDVRHVRPDNGTQPLVRAAGDRRGHRTRPSSWNSRDEMPASIRRAKRALRRKAWAGFRAAVSIVPQAWRRRAEPYARYLDMLLLDHLVLRLAFPNRHQLSDEAWRAA